MKKITYSILVAALALVACKKTPEIVIPDDQKEKISFSMSDGSVGSGTKAGFTSQTRIVARFQSDDKRTTNKKPTIYTKTFLEAQADATNPTTSESFSLVNYVSGNTRYWDDAYGRSAQISVYAVAIPNKADQSLLPDTVLSGNSSWDEENEARNSVSWTVETEAQTNDKIAEQDLAYSNNIQENGKDGRYVWDYSADTPNYPSNTGATTHKDGRLEFTQKACSQSSDEGHFDKGHLVFNHALSRLTITLVKGENFVGPFKFNASTGNIKLIQFPYTGSLNVKTGSWTNVSNNDIKQISGATESAAGNFSAQILPGYKFYGDGDNASKNVMQFVIDDNTYYVTQKQIYTALNTSSNITGDSPLVKVETDNSSNHYIEMKQGKNYLLSITVKKAAIDDVTATLAPWVEVAGNHEVNNAHITLSLKTTGGTCTKDIDLYRLIDNNDDYDQNQYVFTYEGKRWFGDYKTGINSMVTLNQNAYDASSNKQGVQTDASSNNFWSTPWYFESNKEYYHFRTVNHETIVKGNNDATNDYFEIKAGPTGSTDPHWGAPMRASGTTWLKYDENDSPTNYEDDKGYEAHLHHAIGATESKIAIQELHMMSNINVVLKTTNDEGKVQLRKDAVPATYYADADEYNTAKGYTSGDPEYCTDFSSLTEGQKTKTPAEPAVETIVKITRIASTGTVEMGRGVVKPTGAYTNEILMTNPTTYFATDGLVTNSYTYTVVPQSLSRDFNSGDDTDYVGIFIQTPDHNQYYVVKQLCEIIATSVSDERDQTNNGKIKRWYPGHNYTYTFTIKKTGITNVTATVADWVNVTGDNTDLDLEK